MCMEEVDKLHERIKILSLRLTICAKDLGAIQKDLYDILHTLGDIKK